LEELIEKNPHLDKEDMLYSIKPAIKHDKLYEIETIMGAKDQGHGEIISIKQAYLDNLVKDAEIGVQEEYFNVISEIFEVNMLKVKK